MRLSCGQSDRGLKWNARNSDICSRTVWAGMPNCTCTSRAPLWYKNSVVSRICVPRTIESSIISSFLPWINPATGISFICAIRLRRSCFCGINERGHVGVYLINGRAKGMPDALAHSQSRMPFRNPARPPPNRAARYRALREYGRSRSAFVLHSRPHSKWWGNRNTSTGRNRFSSAPLGAIFAPRRPA